MNIITKKFAVCSLISLSVISCGKVDQTALSPNKIFKKFIQPSIPNNIKVFDGKETQVNRLEVNSWVAFDCTSDFWENYQVSKSLKNCDFDITSGGESKVADTGFEGYIDDDYQTYKPVPVGATGYRVFFVKKLKKNNLRIVFYHMET